MAKLRPQDIDPFQGIPNPGTWDFGTIQFTRFAFAGYRSFAAGLSEPQTLALLPDAHLAAFEHGRELAQADAKVRLKRAQFDANPDRPKTADWGT